MNHTFKLTAIYFAISTSLLAADPELVAGAKSVLAVVGHRGSMADRPANTLASFRRGIEAKANFVEVDLRATKDGVLVCMHDATVDHSTDGQGAISELTLAEIRKLDAGKKFDPKFQGERVPTFREVLELCKGKCGVMVDLKEHGPAYSKQIADEIKQFGDPKHVLLGVRRLDHIEQFRKLLPDSLQIGLVPTTKEIEDFHQAGVGVIRIWPKWLSDKEIVPRVRKLNAKLFINTEKGTLEELKSILIYKPDYLSCDDPAQLIKSLDSLKQK